MHPSFCYTPWTNLIIPKTYVELDLSKMRHGPTVTPVTTNRIQDRRFRPHAWSHSPRACYRSPRSLARHHYATHTSYHTTSHPHNPTSQDLARTQPHASNLAISPARPDSRRSTHLLEISLSPYYCLFAIFSFFPFMYIIVLVSALPLSRSRMYLSRYLFRLVV